MDTRPTRLTSLGVLLFWASVLICARAEDAPSPLEAIEKEAAKLGSDRYEDRHGGTQALEALLASLDREPDGLRLRQALKRISDIRKQSGDIQVRDLLSELTDPYRPGASVWRVGDFPGFPLALEIQDGLIVVCGNYGDKRPGGWLRCYSLKDGKRIWEYPEKRLSGVIFLQMQDGKAFALSGDRGKGWIAGYDARTGKKAWEHDLGEGYNWNCLAVNGAGVVAGGWGYRGHPQNNDKVIRLGCYDPKDGRLTWEAKPEELPAGNLLGACSRGNAIISLGRNTGAEMLSQWNWLSCRDVKTGKAAWTRKGGKEGLPWSFDYIRACEDGVVAAGWGGHGDPGGPPGVLTRQGICLGKYDPKSGEAAWIRMPEDIPEMNLHFLEVSGNGVFIGGTDETSGKGWLMNFDLRNGKMIWEKKRDAFPGPLYSLQAGAKNVFASGVSKSTQKGWWGCYETGSGSTLFEKEEGVYLMRLCGAFLVTAGCSQESSDGAKNGVQDIRLEVFRSEGVE